MMALFAVLSSMKEGVVAFEETIGLFKLTYDYLNESTANFCFKEDFREMEVSGPEQAPI
jgi:hypothetical protein